MKKRADGRYQVNVYVGLVDGKKKYKSVFGKTQKEVKEKVAELKIKLNKGIDITADNDTFGDWAKSWLMYKKGTISDGQYNNYATLVKHFDALSNAKLNKLQVYDFQGIVNNLAKRNPTTGKPTSKKTLRDIRMTAQQVFEFAIMNRAVDFNPAKYVELPKEAPKQERRALTIEEQKWVLTFNHQAQLPAVIMMLSGLRLGECLALQWKDIDLENATIDVHKVLRTVGNEAVIKNGAKTKTGVRIVDIPMTLVNFLKKQPPHSPFDYVVTKKNGELINRNSWQSLWKSYLLDLNLAYGDFSAYLNKPKSKFQPGGVPFVIEPFTAHYLRHTHATNLFKAGYDILYIQKQMGHANPEITLNTYTHLVEERKKTSVSKLDKYIEEAI